VDPFTGYRSYDIAQVPAAQVIRRLRDLHMPLDSIRTVLGASDVESRNRELAEHLSRMEKQLEQTQASVAALRSLLTGPAVRPDIRLRSIPAVTALAVEEAVTVEDLTMWAPGAFGELEGALAGGGFRATGCFGALFPGDFFELERAEITLFVPVRADAAPAAGRVRLTQIPAVEGAVAVHEGGMDDIDRTYAALGTAVAERAIGVDGPIREYYTVGFADTDDETLHRTEVCWPVFRTVPA
jgi:DNA-binding transcriptional MerR regulator/effector-binding domain-containing protein